MTDVLVIGAGPAGLSAAINTRAEGLATTLLETRDRCGGQAATSSRIENYLGHADGIAGATLLNSAREQAARLGVTIALGQRVSALRATRRGFEVTAARTFGARAIILATGLEWRRLSFDSPILRYNALPDELTEHDQIAIIGAANSAGQAALHAADHGSRVHLLARRTLEAAMSSYLVERIRAHARIHVRELTELTDADNDHLLLSSGEALAVGAAFVYIGAAPERAPWLDNFAKRDERGYILTRPESYAVDGAAGIYAVGDIRAGSRKRVAAAAGEGAISAAEVWQFLHTEDS